MRLSLSADEFLPTDQRNSSWACRRSTDRHRHHLVSPARELRSRFRAGGAVAAPVAIYCVYGGVRGIDRIASPDIVLAFSSQPDPACAPAAVAISRPPRFTAAKLHHRQCGAHHHRRPKLVGAPLGISKELTISLEKYIRHGDRIGLDIILVLMALLLSEAIEYAWHITLRWRCGRPCREGAR